MPEGDMLPVGNMEGKHPANGIPKPRFIVQVPEGEVVTEVKNDSNKTMPSASCDLKTNPRFKLKLSNGKVSTGSLGVKKASNLWRSKAMSGKRAIHAKKSPSSPRTPNVSEPTSPAGGKFSFQNLVKLNQHREQEKEQIKSLEKQVKSLKQKYEEEKGQKENLQLQVDQLTTEHGVTGNHLLSANEIVEKLGADLKKCKEVLEKSQRHQSQTEDRCHQLELRASGVDQAEIAVQTTQKALENCQFKLREQERRLGVLTEEHEQTIKKLETAEFRVKHLERRVEDLNYQVLQELIKNEKIEKKIESVPYLEEKIQDLEKEVKQERRELEQKGALLTSSRKTTIEYKEKLRDQEGQLRKVQEIQEELDLSKSEVMTLKKLLNGKDVLVFQKSQALDFAKDVIETLQYSCEAEKVERVQELIERSCHLLSTQPNSSSGSLTARSSGTSPECEFTTNESSSASTRKYNRPWTAAAASRGHGYRNSFGYLGSGKQENGFLEKLLTEADLKGNHKHKGSPRNQQRLDGRPHTTQSFPSKVAWFGPHNRNYIHRNEAQTRLRYRPNSDVINGSEDTEIVTISQTISNDNNNTSATRIKMADIVDRIVCEKTTDNLNISVRQDDIYSLFINVGDRIFVKYPEHQRQRSARNSVLQRFGNKPVPKRKLHCGLVKYKGPLEDGQTHLYVGVNLDEPVGDTDGKLGEKRLMYTQKEHGRFIHIHNVVSVFDLPSSCYVELSALKNRFSQKRQATMSTR